MMIDCPKVKQQERVHTKKSHSTTAPNFFKDVSGKWVLYTYRITLVFISSTFKKLLPILPKY